MTENQKAVERVRAAGFPKYDRTLHSKCNKPDEYGIMRVPAAEKALTAPKPPRKDNRKFEHRLSCRLPKSEYTELQIAFKYSEAKTMQDFLRGLIKQYILDTKKERSTERP